MTIDLTSYNRLLNELKPYRVKLVAVSKKKPVSEIMELYNQGHRDFGENYVQELLEKQASLPQDIRWHFIGHLQSNKVKSIAPFVHLIHGVDSLSLLKEINKQAEKFHRMVDCLLQIYIAREETKFGLSFQEADELLHSPEIPSLKNVSIQGMMGMASLTDDEEKIRTEFRNLKSFFESVKKQQLPASKPVDRQSGFEILSMGMTSDYRIALEEGSTMLRIGSAIFGKRGEQ